MSCKPSLIRCKAIGFTFENGNFIQTERVDIKLNYTKNINRVCLTKVQQNAWRLKECDVGLRFIKIAGVVWVSEIEEPGWFHSLSKEFKMAY